MCFEVTRKFETILKSFFAANDDKSPPLTRVLLYSKRSKTLSIYYYLCLLFFVLDAGSVVVQSCLDESSALGRRVFGRAAFLATTSSSSRFRRPLPEAGVESLVDDYFEEEFVRW